MTLKKIPTDSLMRLWCQYLSITEIPLSYQVACGLTAIGALLRRNRWIDQVEFKVWPAQSVLVVGPSGIGKDTVINRTVRMIDHLSADAKLTVMGGATYEGIAARLAQLSKPACAYIPAHELTAFFGKAEYQQTMLAGMTNILSCGDKIDISTKSSQFDKDGKFMNRPIWIYEPTVTMHGGSTVEWLHKQMPDGTLEGGFLGRFLIVCEEFGGRQVPLVKSDKSAAEVKRLYDTLQAFYAGVRDIIAAAWARPREMTILDDAEEIYANWYYNRFRLFSRAVLPYANRSRDMVLRLAMLMALSRGHYRHIEAVDVEFAIEFIKEVAQRIDKVVVPPARGAAIATKIIELVPCPERIVYAALGDRHQIKDIQEALELLRRTNKVWFNTKTAQYEPIGETMEMVH